MRRLLSVIGRLRLKPRRSAARNARCSRCKPAGPALCICPSGAGNEGSDEDDITVDESEEDESEEEDMEYDDTDDYDAEIGDDEHDLEGNADFCSRCEALDISSFVENQNGDSIHDLSSQESYLKLGTYASLLVEESCPMCKLLLALLPEPPEDFSSDLYLVTGWSLHRTEPTMSFEHWRQPEGYRKYAQYFYIGQILPEAQRGDGPRSYYTSCDEALEAASISSESSNCYALLAREVNQLQVDYRLLTQWLDRCDALHPETCKQEWSPELRKIRLIDVQLRKVVPYPKGTRCRYLCLSYVWGGISQESYTLEDAIFHPPRTIEDAMHVTSSLGERFLWVDSICIEQRNENHKKEQIAIMDLIYRGAWATIIAVDSDSANSGLPRMSYRPDMSPRYSQTRCKLGKTQLLTTMPTLRQVCSRSVWAKRAWTLQECSLSPRCLYFSHYQVYFECNAIQLCQSIDETGSWHHERTNADTHQGGFDAKFGYETTYGAGVYRDPATYRSELRHRVLKDGIKHYNDLICQYNSRRMTFDGDCLNACVAVLRQLEKNYFPGGFFWGIPVDFMPYTLLWYHEQEPQRRKGFPAWSWAGWKGPLKVAVSEGHSKIVDEDRNREPPLRCWKCDRSSLVLIYQSFKDEQSSYYPNLFPGCLANKDPIYDAAMEPQMDPEHPSEHHDLRAQWNTSKLLQFPGSRKRTQDFYPNSKVAGYLFIEGLIGRLRFEELPRNDEAASLFKYSLRISIGRARCLLDCFTEHVMVEVRKRKSRNLRFLLVYRTWQLGLETYELLLLDWDDKVGPQCHASQGFVAKRLGPASLLLGHWGYPSYYESIQKLVSHLRLRRGFVVLG